MDEQGEERELLNERALCAESPSVEDESGGNNNVMRPKQMQERKDNSRGDLLQYNSSRLTPLGLPLVFLVPFFIFSPAFVSHAHLPLQIGIHTEQAVAVT